MGGGAIPTPSTTTGNHHSQPLYSPVRSPFSSNLSTGLSDLIDENDKRAVGYPFQTNFLHVPSQMEVLNAISDLQRVMNGFDAMSSEIDENCLKNVMTSMGQKRLLDAYHLLQKDPLVQRLVLSISSDTRVWDAILKNGAVQDLQGSLPLEETEVCTAYKQEPNSISVIVKLIFGVMKSKIIKFIEKLEVLLLETLHVVFKKGTSTSKVGDDLVEEKVRSSLLLSIVIIVIVVVTRSMET